MSRDLRDAGHLAGMCWFRPAILLAIDPDGSDT